MKREENWIWVKKMNSEESKMMEDLQKRTEESLNVMTLMVGWGDKKQRSSCSR